MYLNAPQALYVFCTEASEDRRYSENLTDTWRNGEMAMVSRQAISFLFASAGAALVSPADQTPFPLIKSSEIFHLSVSRPGRCCGGEQPSVSVDCVILQFTSDADNIIAVSLMSPRLALVQPCAPTARPRLACLCGSDRSNTSACCLDLSPQRPVQSGDQKSLQGNGRKGTLHAKILWEFHLQNIAVCTASEISTAHSSLSGLRLSCV